MPRFRYVALDAGGAQITGECESSEPETLGLSLAASGLTLLQLEVLQSAGGAPLNDVESYALAQHVAGLASSGLPMPSGLRALGEELPKGRLRKVVGDLADRMERGESLEEAFDALGSRLPGYLRGLILTGSRGGKLGTVLGDFVSYAQAGVALQRGLMMSLAYPIMLLALFGAFMAFVCLILVQKFKEIFMDFGVDLPWLTRDLIAISDLVVQAGWGIVWGPVAMIGAGVLLSRVLLEPAARRRLLCNVPLIGSIWRLTSLAQWTRFLALLIDANLTMVEALPLAAECTRDADLILASRRASAILEYGGGLASALASSSVFPDGLTRLLHWAEENNATVAALNLVSEIFDSRAKAQSQYVSSVVGIAVAIFVFWGCAFTIVALFWPLVSLISKLSG